jgi:magnesium chelatase subunit H
MASKRAAAAVPIRVVVVTLDAHLADAFGRAQQMLAKDLPALTLRMHVAADFATDAEAVTRATADIATADIVIGTQLFTEESAGPLKEAIAARREAADATVCMLCVNELVRLTRLGGFSMSEEGTRSPWSPISLLKRLRGERKDGKSAGERQLTMLRQLPKLLRFIPGTAQDVRAWFLLMQ